MFSSRKHDITSQEGDNIKTIAVLDGLEYPGNIGTIFRTADAAMIDCIILIDCKTNVNNEKTITSSRGMVFKVPFYVMELSQTQRFLLDYDFDILLCEPKDGVSYTNINYDNKIAMVFGSERYGINDVWFSCLSKKVYIPMFGDMESLNVGVAASLIMYQSYLRKQNYD